jgi:hypothetical protein
VLCFPHGDAAGSLVHEGSAVKKGVKYDGICGSAAADDDDDDDDKLMLS